MRIVFFGTPALALPSLVSLSSAHEVCALVCQPDRPHGRGKKLRPPEIKVWALEHGIEVHQPTKLNDGAFEEWLKERRPDVCALAAYGRILKQAILDVPEKGFLNVHPSLLPRHRGPSPIQTALLEGDTVTGVTIIELTGQVDAGPVLLSRELRVEEADHCGSLTEKLGALGAELMLEAVNLVAAGEAEFTEQDESQATYTNQFEKKDGLIDWCMPAARIHNLVRAANPWPLAHSYFRESPLRIYETRQTEESASAEPGEIARVEAEEILVNTGDTLLALRTVQSAGKRMMAVSDFLRGYRMDAGETFGSN